MLAVLNRHKLLFVILLLMLFAIMIWLFMIIQGDSKVPSKGTFVLERTFLSSGRGL